jgi:hypothetical protein
MNDIDGAIIQLIKNVVGPMGELSLSDTDNTPIARHEFNLLVSCFVLLVGIVAGDED